MGRHCPLLHEALTHVRDFFVVKANDTIPLEFALLTAVAIHSRFFEMI